jgi:hypothetical protein
MKKIIICFLSLLVLISCSSVRSAPLDDIINDMKLNEAPLLNTTKTGGWGSGAVIDMGIASRGDSTQSYWQPDNKNYKSSTAWKTIAPWFVLYPGTNHKATNVRVKFEGLKIYFLLKSTKVWKKVEEVGSGPGWAKNMNFGLNSEASLNSPVDRRLETDGSYSYKLQPEFYPIHGGSSKYNLIDYGIDPLDIAGVVMEFRTQLILHDPNGTDDRASSEILAQVGGDYYPSLATQVSDYSPMKYAPASGSSKFGKISNTLRTHYFASINPPGSKNDSVYVKNGGSVTMLFDDFKSNQPPHFFDTIKPNTPTELKIKFTKLSSSGQSEISWKVSTDNLAVAGYKIYRDGIVVGKTSKTSFIDIIKVKASGKTYIYNIIAFDDAYNVSNQSNKVFIVY